MSKQENIFDSAHEYESGNFNLVRDENLNIIINILQDKLPTDTEYEIQIDTVANIIKIQFSKERADVNYNAIKESVLNALNNSKLNWSVNIIF